MAAGSWANAAARGSAWYAAANATRIHGPGARQSSSDGIPNDVPPDAAAPTKWQRTAAANGISISDDDGSEPRDAWRHGWAGSKSREYGYGLCSKIWWTAGAHNDGPHDDAGRTVPGPVWAAGYAAWADARPARPSRWVAAESDDATADVSTTHGTWTSASNARARKLICSSLARFLFLLYRIIVGAFTGLFRYGCCSIGADFVWW